MLVLHDVDDVDHWLSSSKREEVFGPMGITVRTFRRENSNSVGLIVDTPDMATWESAMQSDAAAEADEARRRQARDSRRSDRGLDISPLHRRRHSARATVRWPPAPGGRSPAHARTTRVLRGRCCQRSIIPVQRCESYPRFMYPRCICGWMITHLFAAVPVADLKASVRWYGRLFGRRADLIPNDTEAAWQVRRVPGSAWS